MTTPRYPFHRTGGVDLPAGLRALTGQRPVRVHLWDQSRAWLVTSWRDARAVLTDRSFSADVTRPGYPFLAPGRDALVQRPTFLRMDDPGHARLRRMVQPHFTSRRLDALQPQLHALTHRLLDTIENLGPPTDFVAHLTSLLPAHTICLLLGVPDADIAFFTDATQILGTHDVTADAKNAAAEQLLHYLQQLITRYTTRPGPGILGDLARTHVAAGTASAEESTDIGRLLLTAGHETTAGLLSLALLSLADHRDLQTQLRANPDQVPQAVEELVRIHTVIHTGVTRVATTATDLHGTTIAVGDAVIVSLAAANRDPAVFPNPDRLQLDRAALSHLAFGVGVHQCLGQILARRQLAHVLTAVTRRLPYLRRAEPDAPLIFTAEAGVYGLHALPLAW
jgi:cytochrome P450